MDGLQVLAIVRRRFPQLRIVVMTSVMDEQYRNRAYGLGVDLFWQKPGTEQEIKLFLECIESLLGREELGGFRGVQSKSLMDIIQLECMSKNSAVLKITNGPLEGRIWIQDGDILDASVADLTGWDAFKKMYSWKGGSFENMPAEPGRTRTIFGDYQGLLLDAAQAVDEASATPGADLPPAEGEEARPRMSPITTISKVKGVEFALSVPVDEKQAPETWGVANPDPLAKWTREAIKTFRALGEQFVAGELAEIEGHGLQRHVTLTVGTEKHLCVGLQRSLTPDQIRETMKIILTAWVS
jgi:CheY-like chemotaxis protein